MLNKYPLWKYLLLVGILALGIIYALPNIFGEDPAVQVLPATGYSIDANKQQEIKSTLEDAKLSYKSIKFDGTAILVRLNDTPTQINAKEVLKDKLGEGYIVALNLAPVTPWWLDIFGAKPMKLGLDLRGGVHFLMEVDVDSAIARRLDGVLSDARGAFRQAEIRYRNVKIQEYSAIFTFDDESTVSTAKSILEKQFGGEFEFVRSSEPNVLQLQLRNKAVQEIRNYTVEQTISTLSNRVNELGVAEAVVQRQGLNHVVVELPGIQDTARAKDILGKTATLEFHLLANDQLMSNPGQRAAPGTKWYYKRDGSPRLLNKRVILAGDSITGAVVGTEERTGRPAVHVRVSGQGLSLFKKVTRENIGKNMGVVYIESKVKLEEVDGQVIRTVENKETLVSDATIQSALGSQFQITGFSLKEAQDLALILRAGALPATVTIVEERTVGPSLGQENIRLGVISIEVGLALVLIFMALYYSVFGIFANLALLINVVLLVAILSLVGATLTLPGIAGIVLTVGMAVDANVLIFERIREELRLGMSPQAAIHSGFERAFATIVDANLTTLIVAIILFSVGTGPVRGFAVTLSIGILTSMLTAISGTRAMVNLTYGGRSVKRLRVGI